MQPSPEHDRLTYDHPLPAAFQRTAMEAHLMRGRMLHGQAVRRDLGALRRRILRLFGLRIEPTPHREAA